MIKPWLRFKNLRVLGGQKAAQNHFYFTCNSFQQYYYTSTSLSLDGWQLQHYSSVWDVAKYSLICSMYIFIQPRCCSPINCIYSFSGFLHAAYKNWNCCITFCLWSQCCFPSIPFCYDSWVCVFCMSSAPATFSSYSQTIFIIITTPPIHCILNCIAWFMCWHWIEPLVVGIPDLPQLRSKCIANALRF